MKKALCLTVVFFLLFLTSCNIAEPIDTPEKVESPSESSPESSLDPESSSESSPESTSTPIEESTPIPEVSESELETTVPSSEINVDPDFYKNYNMFLYGGTWSGDFNANVQRLIYNNQEYTDSLAEKNKFLTYNSSNIQLVYQETVESFNDKYHLYKSDQGIEARYDVQTNELLLIDDRTLDTIGLTPDEDECKNLAEKFIQKIMGVSLSDYIYSCETWYLKNYANGQGVASKVVPYFYVPEDSLEELLSYKFTYTRYVDSYKTSDCIYIEFFDNAFHTGIKARFDKNQFTNITDVDLEYEDAKAAVESFCRAYFSNDREIISVDVEDCCLTFIEDKMYLDCSVGIDFIYKDNTYSILESILIEIE